MRYYKTHGIVLRVRKGKDKDRIVTLFTPDRGKITAVSRGSRDPKSKHCGVINEYHHIVTQLYDGNGLPTMTQSQLTRSYLRERNLQDFAVASFIAETVDCLIEEEHYVEALFPFVQKAFEIVDQKNYSSFAPLFTIKLLSLLGYVPELNKCSSCFASLRNATQVYLNEVEHVVCESCKSSVYKEIPLGCVKLLYFVQQHDFDAVMQLEIPAEYTPVLSDLAHKLFYAVTHRERRTEAFLTS